MVRDTSYKSRDVSVVIATLGGSSLRTTIDRLNAGSVAPAEILVCIPKKDAYKVSTYTCLNVRVLATDCKGQVAQRIMGFIAASHDLVMQIDDDVVVESDCLELLIKGMENIGQKCAIAPALRWLCDRQSVYDKVSPPAVSKIVFWLLNGKTGYKPGAVTSGGAEIGVRCVNPQAGVMDVEWLAGGCVLHKKESLMLEDYFPFEGKAFCEDLIHSFHLRKRGVRLFVSNEAVAYLSRDDAAEGSLGPFLRSLMADFRARRYYVELSSRSKLRMYLFFLARIVSRIVR